MLNITLNSGRKFTVRFLTMNHDDNHGWVESDGMARAFLPKNLWNEVGNDFELTEDELDCMRQKTREFIDECKKIPCLAGRLEFLAHFREVK